jgi:hypothetical protein
VQQKAIFFHVNPCRCMRQKAIFFLCRRLHSTKRRVFTLHASILY